VAMYFRETRARAATLIARYITYSETPREEQQEFLAYAHDLTVRHARFLFLIFSISLIVTWPSDALFFAEAPVVQWSFAIWRGSMLLTFTTFAFLLYRWSSLKHRIWIDPLIGICTTASALTTGYGMGLIGGLDQVFFYGVYSFSALSIPLLIDLRRRTLLNIAIVSGYLGGYFGMFPSHLTHPYLPSVSILLLYTNIGYIVVGHVIYHLTRVNFFQQRALRKQQLELAEAMRLSNRLLLNVLPEPIAVRLRNDEQPIADSFAEVTVLFSDLVGFTPLSASMSPEQLVNFLNDLFSTFDVLAEKHGLEKIKTIGDAYMVAGGLPARRKDHAEAIAELALDMLEAVSGLRTPAGGQLQMRIGIHTGPVVAGVIGIRKFIYDLWGDTVNTASRMESHGLPGAIQVTGATYDRLKERYRFEERHTIDVKGKGPLVTYLLKDRREPLPA